MTPSSRLPSLTLSSTPTISPSAVRPFYIFNYTGSVQTFALPSSQFNAVSVVAVGASGGDCNSSRVNGGVGGVVQATIKVNPGEILYLYVGGNGACSCCQYGIDHNCPVGSSVIGGYNGGGKSYEIASCSGGGATDIRINGNSLTNRILVAGGGGGSAGSKNSGNNVGESKGGSGGGLIGGSGANNPLYDGGSNCQGTPATGGNQITGGLTGQGCNSGSNGVFGYGGATTSYGGFGGGKYFIFVYDNFIQS